MSNLVARLNHLAAQENNDSEEYNLMVKAATRIEELETALHNVLVSKRGSWVFTPDKK